MIFILVCTDIQVWASSIEGALPHFKDTRSQCDCFWNVTLKNTGPTLTFLIMIIANLCLMWIKTTLIWSDSFRSLRQTVKRPRKVAVHSLKPPPSPGGDSRDYAPPTHYYDADNDNGWYRNESREHTSDVKGYLDPEYRGGRDYNHRGRTRGRSQDRSSPSPDRSRREASRGRARDSSGDQQRYHSRGRSPGDNYRTEDKYERGEGGGGRGGRYRSRDRLNDNSPSPEPSRELEPLDKPVNVLLVKNRPSEGRRCC